MGLALAGRVLLWGMKMRTSMSTTVKSTSPTATETGSVLRGKEKVDL